MVLAHVLCLSFLVGCINSYCMQSNDKGRVPQSVKLDQRTMSIEQEPLIILAARQGYWKKVIELFEQGHPVDVRNMQGLTALHIAASHNDIEMAITLLQRCANPNARCWLGFTPLHLAVAYGHVDMTKLLLEFGARPDEKTNLDETPIQLATAHGYEQIIMILLEKIERIRSKLSRQLTPQGVLGTIGL